MAHDRFVQVVGIISVALFLSACAARSSPRDISPTQAVVELPYVPASSPTAVPCACAASGEPLPSPTTRDFPTPASGWFYVTDLSKADKGDDLSGDTNIALTITAARFGTLIAETDADAGCVAKGNFQSGAVIPGLGFRRADSAGHVRWIYTAPLVERGMTTYTVTCSKENSMQTAQVLFFIN